MLLCLDVGNSHIYGGVLNQDNEIILRFRHESSASCSSDQLGVFLKSVLRENQLDDNNIDAIAVCSVVPNLEYSLRAACKKYFSLTPFMLQAGVKTGLRINYRNPQEVGADRIANAMASIKRYPNQNLIIVDLGTATTICVVTADKNYLGGIILPGMKVSMMCLQQSTAKLPTVEILKPKSCVGRSTVEGIQSGLYYSQLAVIKEVTRMISINEFHNQDYTVIGTGGFSHLFESESVFAVIHPDLVLEGLHQAWMLNTKTDV